MTKRGKFVCATMGGCTLLNALSAAMLVAGGHFIAAAGAVGAALLTAKLFNGRMENEREWARWKSNELSQDDRELAQFLLEAQREVDAMYPGTPPISPPKPTPYQIKQARGMQDAAASWDEATRRWHAAGAQALGADTPRMPTGGTQELADRAALSAQQAEATQRFIATLQRQQDRADEASIPGYKKASLDLPPCTAMVTARGPVRLAEMTRQELVAEWIRARQYGDDHLADGLVSEYVNRQQSERKESVN